MTQEQWNYCNAYSSYHGIAEEQNLIKLKPAFDFYILLVRAAAVKAESIAPDMASARTAERYQVVLLELGWVLGSPRRRT